MADIIDGTVLIRTFLFLTNDGTPEGEKLKELVGISAVGEKYFEIDKISTFLYSDIDKDEQLKSIFIKAGCESLFSVKSISSKQGDEIKAAAAIAKYLSLGETADVES